MEYDSESSCDGRPRDVKAAENRSQSSKCQWHIDRPLTTFDSTPWHSVLTLSTQPRLQLSTVNKSLSSQVMEYYQKYSQSSNLDQYFSLPSSSMPSETAKYYYSVYELNPRLVDSRQDCIREEYSLRSYAPRERRRWIRPALVGQSLNPETSSRYIHSLTNHSPSPDLKHGTPETILEEKIETQEILQDTTDRKMSPTSSVTSHKPLEWDSGADVGYFNTLPHNKQCNKKLSTVERMALARGCSAAMRLDPEGTTESEVSRKLSTKLTAQSNPKSSMTPNANSTPIIVNVSDSESDIEITPIMKNHLPGIIAGGDIVSDEKSHLKDVKQQHSTGTHNSKSKESVETPTFSFTFKAPPVKYPTERKRIQKAKEAVHIDNACSPKLPLKRSTSMNTLTAHSSKLILKRSQSDFNLRMKDKNTGLPMIFNSTSSIVTVVNKPTTCDKVIQTSLNTYTQESVGVQVSAIKEEKPPLPKRGTSLQMSLHSILKNPKSAYKTRDIREHNTNQGKVSEINGECIEENKLCRSSLEVSQNRSTAVTPQPDDLENITGKANSFEYFPGHVYENVPSGGSSHISSSETSKSSSTLPNTSSSINEKLWGESDSLVRDLERSVNILRSLVDANKCDKQIRKRLIHHVVKRLVTAKYTDDKIEHNLEENVPWNPDDARNKVYKSEILQALTKKHSTTDSSDDWKPLKKDFHIQKPMENGRGTSKSKEITLDSSNSDKFDRNTDRTETDGRKARMGLRTDNCQRSSNTPTDLDKSESSECFLPQRSHNTNRVKDIFCLQEKCVLPHGESTTTNSTPPDRNRMLLETVVSNRRAPVESSNIAENNIDWRLPTTLSERKFELKKCSSSDSGDSKLVNYAEMEKRNQLIWITNEISHLCNLKKLLEQPRKLERPRSSPRKSKSATSKSNSMKVTHRQGDGTEYMYRDTSDVRGNSIDDQWSSHCNLAACQPTTSSTSCNIVRRVKERNSCTQTASSSTNAHSKTGGEIISTSKLQTNIVKLVNTGVQTVTLDTSPGSIPLQTDFVHCVKYTVHKTPMYFQGSCKCNGGQACQKHSISSIQNMCMNCSQNQNQLETNTYQKAQSSEYLKEDASIVQQPSSNHVSNNSINSLEQFCRHMESTQYKQKETKNQINASKSKCSCEYGAARTCQYVNDCTTKLSSIEEKGIECDKIISNVCQSCSKQIAAIEATKTVRRCEQCQERIFYAREEKNGNSIGKCTCASICECENDHEMEQGKSRISAKHSYCQDKNGHALSCNNQKEIVESRCSSECVCENRQKEERILKVCDCYSNGRIWYPSELYQYRPKAETHMQVRPYLSKGRENENSRNQNVQSSLKCNCPDKTKHTADVFHGKSCNANSNRISESRSSSSESERSGKYCCTCGTIYQNARKCESECHQTYPKAVAYELSFTKQDNQKNNASNISVMPKAPLSNLFLSGIQSNGCACDKMKKRSANKKDYERKTLQDYLLKNKPEFVGNAEMRRQYMSEISRLRQLRKEKRVQLLAIASTSNMKSPKVSKSIVSIQRKLTDEEMKEQLRKRYLRLKEVRFKRWQQERQEEVRRNNLMAKIFCKKLQQKVLRGQVDLSQSVSVISNL